MVTLVDSVKNRNVTKQGGYDGYIEPDTKVPPKARPVLNDVSVNGVAIPEAEILAETQNHPAESPGMAAAAAAKALVVKELLLQEAMRLRMKGHPQADETGRVEAEEDAAISRLLDQEIDVPVATDEECQRYFENNGPRFQSEPIYEACHILLPAVATDMAKRREAKEQALNIIAKLDEGKASFGEMAREFSACPSSQQGGNLGQLTKGSTVPDFEAALEHIPEGRLCAEPVETPFGYHVIKLERKIPGASLPFEHVKERIAAWLEAASWSRAISQYVGILASKAKIKGVELATSDSPLVQ